MPKSILKNQNLAQIEPRAPIPTSPYENLEKTIVAGSTDAFTGEIIEKSEKTIVAGSTEAFTGEIFEKTFQEDSAEKNSTEISGRVSKFKQRKMDSNKNS